MAQVYRGGGCKLRNFETEMMLYNLGAFGAQCILVWGPFLLKLFSGGVWFRNPTYFPVYKFIVLPNNIISSPVD